MNISKNNQNELFYINKGLSFLKQRKYNEAEENFKKAIEINPQNDSAYYNLGNIYKRQQKYNEAEESYKKAIEINPQNDSAYNNLGILYQLQQKYSNAEESYKKAIEINPQNDSAYYNLGIIYQQQQKYSNAEESYKKAIEINPQKDSAYYNLGNIYQLQQKYSNAEESYKKAIKINSIPVYKNSLSEVNRKLEDYKEALFNRLDNLGKYEIELESFENLVKKIGHSLYKEFFASTNSYNSEVNEIISEIEKNNLKIVDSLYVDLIKLMISVNNFKYKSLVTKSDGIQKLYQYTSINTLKSMLNLNTCCEDTNVNIRLYNTDYMNDPDEGEFFINQLKKRGNEGLLDSKYSVSHAFISSLTLNKDDIPMWSMYGNNSKGVSIGFGNFPVAPILGDNSEDDLEESQEISVDSDSDIIETKTPAYPYIEEKAKVYKVTYIDPYLEKSPEIEIFNKIIKSISVELTNNKGIGNNLYDSISKFISVELDRIKFLIKNKKYEYENEYRILQMVKVLSINNSLIKYDSNNPKLYLEVDKIKLEEVIFGVNSDSCTLWRPVLEMKIPDINIEKINQSSIPLRYN